MNIKEREKELEEIKWQYWNKGKTFKLLWQYYRAKKLDTSTPFPDKFKGNHNLRMATQEYALFWMNHEPETASFDDYWNFKQKVRREFAVNKEKRASERVSYTASLFFPDKRQTWIKDFLGETKFKHVEDYSGLIAGNIDEFVSIVNKTRNRPPTIDELKEYLTNQLMPSSCLTLQIHQWELSEKETKEIIKEVSLILKDRTYRIKPEIKALKQYLHVYESYYEHNKTTNGKKKTAIDVFNELKLKIEKQKNPKKVNSEFRDLTNEEKLVEIEKAKSKVVYDCVRFARKIIGNLEAGKGKHARLTNNKKWWIVERERKPTK